MEISPIPGSRLGAVVRGADVSAGLDDKGVAAIWEALDERLVLVLREHKDPSDEDLLAFGRKFGTIPRTGLTAGANPDHNEILIISNIEVDGRKIGVGDAGWMNWHTDYSFRPRVSRLGFLAAVELPEHGGGQTLFTDMYAVFESLPAELRERLLTYRSRHALRAGYEETIEEEFQGEVSVPESPDAPLISPEAGTSTIHPLVARNPRTGRRSLYVNPLNTKRILELDAEASRELLPALFDTAGEPSLTYVHEWQPGDIVMWDQLGTVHAKRPFDPADRRMLRKVVAIFDDPAEPWHAGSPA